MRVHPFAAGQELSGRSLGSRLHSFVSRQLVPGLILVLSLLALISGSSHYSLSGSTSIPLRVVTDENGAITPAVARDALADRATVRFFDTHLSEQPVWFRFQVAPLLTNEPVIVEFPSRHAQGIVCWDADSLALLGRSYRSDGEGATQGRISMSKAGFAMRLGKLSAPQSLLCRTTFSGPARLSVEVWGADTFSESNEQFIRDTSLLEGGLLMLAAFVLVAALINRETVCLLFSVWLVGNLRLAALSMGSDTEWLGFAIPSAWMPLIRQLTIALYFWSTCELLDTVLRRELVRIDHYVPALKIAHLLGMLLLLLALALPYRQFLPVMWVIASIGIGGVIYILTRIIVQTRSRVAIWFGGSLGVTMLAGMSEVIGAAFGARTLTHNLNSVTAALLSSLMAALAIAEQMRIERQWRALMQAQLRQTYDMTPIGLFTLSADGKIIRCNPALKRMMRWSTDSDSRLWADLFEEGAWERVRAAAESGTDHEIELRGIPLAGHPARWFSIKATVARGQIEGSIQDITQRVGERERSRVERARRPFKPVAETVPVETELGVLAEDEGSNGGGVGNP
jgi:PAS domain-containing protein